MVNKLELLLVSWLSEAISNMDQTRLKFCFNRKGVTYTTSGEKKAVWWRATGSAQDKWQFTVPVTLFDDSMLVLKFCVIFEGDRSQNCCKGKQQYNN